MKPDYLFGNVTVLMQNNDQAVVNITDVKLAADAH